MQYLFYFSSTHHLAVAVCVIQQLGHNGLLPTNLFIRLCHFDPRDRSAPLPVTHRESAQLRDRQPCQELQDHSVTGGLVWVGQARIQQGRHLIFCQISPGQSPAGNGGQPLPAFTGLCPQGVVGQQPICAARTLQYISQDDPIHPLCIRIASLAPLAVGQLLHLFLHRGGIAALEQLHTSHRWAQSLLPVAPIVLRLAGPFVITLDHSTAQGGVSLQSHVRPGATPDSVKDHIRVLYGYALDFPLRPNNQVLRSLPLFAAQRDPSFLQGLSVRPQQIQGRFPSPVFNLTRLGHPIDESAPSGHGSSLIYLWSAHFGTSFL